MDKLDIQKIFNEYSVRTAPEEHKHHRNGWINTKCPFCSGDDGYHLGFNIQNIYASCWRCGHHSIQKGISGVLGVSYKKAKELIKAYSRYNGIRSTTKPQIKAQKKAFRTPNTIPLKEGTPGFNYLRKRGFSVWDIQKLEYYFNVQQTGPVCSFKMNDKPVNLKFRIFAPIYYKGKMVSWQTRDITDKSALKYITCPKSIEKINHKTLLYMYRNAWWVSFPKYIFLTEGVFDVWKIHLAGYFAGCGFGVELTIDQIYFLKKNFNKVIFFLDPDKAGQRKGKEVFSQLTFAGVHCVKVLNNTGKDPGDMYVKELNKLLRGYV